MSVKTTLNINKKVLEQINLASDQSGISRSEIIILLLMKVMDHGTDKAALSGSIKYQDRDDAEMWHKFHISLKEDEYNYFIGLRNILKSSLSRLVAYAVKKYLDELINGKTNDNSYFHGYILAKETVNGIICWKIFWGIPEYREKFTQLS